MIHLVSLYHAHIDKYLYVCHLIAEFNPPEWLIANLLRVTHLNHNLIFYWYMYDKAYKYEWTIKGHVWRWDWAMCSKWVNHFKLNCWRRSRGFILLFQEKGKICFGLLTWCLWKHHMWCFLEHKEGQLELVFGGKHCQSTQVFANYDSFQSSSALYKTRNLVGLGKKRKRKRGDMNKHSKDMCHNELDYVFKMC